ncbi:sigma-70 family RNA polymerase sigma factor [Rhodobacteraceae bacterium D3-12]|nr:sigma-70 family RNA polymerase sigma factor [Rhodobacteraceae bacterium D3-12]
MTHDDKLTAFQNARPQLVGVAYRLLGSISEAEDAVQDTSVKWFGLSPPMPDNPVAWLTTVCTNRCLDILKSSHRQKMDYIGPWLPDHLATETALDAEQSLEIASSLTTAFLLMMERLTPKERAAYLLHDIFDMSYGEVANCLGLSEVNCRKLASRARRMIGQENVRFVPDEAQQRKLLAAFQNALVSGSADQLTRMLAEEADLRADSGGKVVAITQVLEGADAVAGFITGTLSIAWAETAMTVQMVNGQLGLVLRDNDTPFAVVTFGYDRSGLVQSVFIQRNPSKLANSEGVAARPDVNGGLTLN